MFAADATSPSRDPRVTAVSVDRRLVLGGISPYRFRGAIEDAAVVARNGAICPAPADSR